MCSKVCNFFTSSSHDIILTILYYFNDSLLIGDLSVEEEVLQWLITQRTEDRIELITRVMLETSVEETQYLAVYFSKFIIFEE